MLTLGQDSIIVDKALEKGREFARRAVASLYPGAERCFRRPDHPGAGRGVDPRRGRQHSRRRRHQRRHLGE
jgi:hypothetical protein